MTSEKSLLEAIKPLIIEIESKSHTLATLKEASFQARQAETQAVNRLNDAQKQLDNAIAELHKSADIDTDWGKVRRVVHQL